METELRNGNVSSISGNRLDYQLTLSENTSIKAVHSALGPIATSAWLLGSALGSLGRGREHWLRLVQEPSKAGL